MRILGAIVVLTCLAGPLSAQEITGRWRGRWEDYKSGHNGPLRAKVKSTGCAEYRAVFTGRFYGVIPFRFSAKLQTTAAGDDVILHSGDQRLFLFGNFHYSAVASDHSFDADYSSRRWTGRFTLSR